MIKVIKTIYNGKPMTVDEADAAMREPYAIIGMAGAIELIKGAWWIAKGILFAVLSTFGLLLQGLAWLVSGGMTESVLNAVGAGFDPDGSRLPEWKKVVPVAQPKEKNARQSNAVEVDPEIYTIPQIMGMTDAEFNQKIRWREKYRTRHEMIEDLKITGGGNANTDNEITL